MPAWLESAIAIMLFLLVAGGIVMALLNHVSLIEEDLGTGDGADDEGDVEDRRRG